MPHPAHMHSNSSLWHYLEPPHPTLCWMVLCLPNISVICFLTLQSCILLLDTLLPTQIWLCYQPASAYWPAVRPGSQGHFPIHRAPIRGLYNIQDLHSTLCLTLARIAPKLVVNHCWDLHIALWFTSAMTVPIPCYYSFHRTKHISCFYSDYMPRCG